MRRDASKETFWRETLAQLGSSGQSVQEFCRQRGLKAGLLYIWRRELRARDAEMTGKAGFVELLGPGDRSGMADSGVAVRIDHRIHIMVGRGFDPETLKTAVGCLLTVTAPPCCTALQGGGEPSRASEGSHQAEATGS